MNEEEEILLESENYRRLFSDGYYIYQWNEIIILCNLIYFILPTISPSTYHDSASSAVRVMPFYWHFGLFTRSPLSSVDLICAFWDYVLLVCFFFISHF